jgi:PAS domain S-box-containing protein
MSDAATPASILIVDDNEGTLRLIQKALQREGFSSVTAGSGREAITWLLRNRPDLMLLDLKLPDIEGRALVDHLTEIHHAVPFIIITGQGDERVAVEMMKRGALDYLVKDVQFIEFVPTVVRRALDHLAREKRLAEAEETLRRSEAMLARAQEIAHVGGYEINAAGTGGDHWSEESFRILGLDPATKELIPSEYLLRCVHPEDQGRVREAFDRSRKERVRFDLEYRIVRPDGSIRHVHSIVEPVAGTDNQVVKLVGTLHDITERKRLEWEILDISEREQRRFGHDLHDGLGQRLTGLEMFSHGLAKDLKGHAPALAKQARRLNRELRETVTQARLIAHGLAPVPLEGDGLMQGLMELAASTSRIAGVKCRFHCDPPVCIQDVKTATHLYRIAQEAVNNALKHGRAGTIDITLTGWPNGWELRVENNGRALPPANRAKHGMGLNVMRYRAGVIGARLVIEPGKRKGARVTCSLRRQT